MTTKYYFKHFILFCGICITSLSGWCTYIGMNGPHGLGRALAPVLGGPVILLGIFLILFSIKKKPDIKNQEPEID